MALSSGPDLPRRLFLGAAGAAALGTLWPRGGAAAEPQGHVLVCVNLRGGLDGSSLLVPYGEDAYYRARPRLAVPPPRHPLGALPLADGFGLHPTLEPLYQMYLAGTLAIVPAAGGRFFGRSHFEARELLHTAAPTAEYSVRPDDGWANRYEGLRTSQSSTSSLFSTTAELPHAFVGHRPAQSTSRPPFFREESDQAHWAALRRLYRDQRDPFARSAEHALAAAKELEEKTRRVRVRGDYPSSVSGLRDAVRIIQADVGAEIIWVDVQGFDTHRSQANALAKRFSELGRGLASFRSDLGRRFSDVTLVTLTEFGRTLRETGAGGTDHGTASCMLVLGGRVRGGRMVGAWPGLGPEALNENRDLAVTTDYRAVLGEVLSGHLGLTREGLAQVLPGFDLGAQPPLGLY